MDAAGLAVTVISITMLGIEGIFSASEAVQVANRVNDELHRAHQLGPYAKRFEVFGCVAMQDPAAVAVEAERCIKELGFLGILVNGYSNIGGAYRGPVSRRTAV